MSPSSSPLLLLLAASFLFSPLLAQPYDFPNANLSTLWTNSPSLLRTVTYIDGTAVRAVLLRSNPAGYGPSFAAGFFCAATPCDAFLFAVFIVYTDSGALITYPNVGVPRVIWSANRARPVGENATLQLSASGNLALSDADGILVWSTETSGRNVTRLTITESGNLVLLNQKNTSVWQSFDHPTDSLVIGQSLTEGARLTANTSATNWTQSNLYLTMLTDGLYAFVDSNPPQLYFETAISGTKAENKSTYATFMNGSLAIFVLFSERGRPDLEIGLPTAKSVQYMRLESDGHLRLYEWIEGWAVVAEVLDVYPDDCAYPTVCGEYGICSEGQCSCPGRGDGSSNYFRPVNDVHPNLGCTPVTPISCQFMNDHHLAALNNVSYFNYIDPNAAAFQGADAESCKQACMSNCSCKAALFQYGQNASDGSCFLPSELFSLESNLPQVSHYNSLAYIKVQLVPSPPPSPAPSNGSGPRVAVILGSTFGALFVLFTIIGIAIVLVRRLHINGDEEDFIENLPGMPAKFSFEDLRAATWNFNTKLGQGGFGSVFEGKIGEEKVAVKRLDGVGQGKKEFLAEVETIGNIHHISLVRLVGFCAEKSHRLLVYEFMSNGSLDKWIFYRDQNTPLDWQTKYRIIGDIAKGLCYLHEECRQRIVHLDIKPQNILLDGNFNAKVSDFGLSKLIDRDQSQVMTRMRGTPGYLAPEWLTSKITEKVDVYSFGVVVMEIICGRRNIDHSQPEESVHQIGLLQEKIKNDQLVDLIDKHGNDMQLQLYGEEIIRTMRLAVWCLQGDSCRRPSMSMVVKVLEGTADVETNLDCNLVTSGAQLSSQAGHLDCTFSPSASILSGPQ